MRLDLAPLAAGETVREAYEDDVTLHFEERPTVVHARGDIRVERTLRGARLQGRVQSEVPLLCSRCLRDLREGVEADLDEEFALGPAPPVRGELGRQDVIAWIGPDMTLDVGDIVRQHLEMAVPMAPLCRPDCRGLCPVCGANWNDRTCAHMPDGENRQRG